MVLPGATEIEQQQKQEQEVVQKPGVDESTHQAEEHAAQSPGTLTTHSTSAFSEINHVPSMRPSPIVDLLEQRLRRWSKVKPTMGKRLMIARGLVSWVKCSGPISSFSFI